MQSELLAIQMPSEPETDKQFVELRLATPTGDVQTETLIIFLHFMGGSARTYDQVINSLSDRHLNDAYLAISYRGAGGTPRSGKDRPEMCSVLPRAKQVLEVLRSSRIAEIWAGARRLIIVAQSMSAKVSYVLLDLLAQERKDDGVLSDVDVQGLILLGPAPIGPLHFPPEMREQQLHAYDNMDSAKWTVQNILSHRPLSVELVDALAKDCVNTSAAAKAGWMDYGMVFDCSEYAGRLKRNWPALQVRVVIGKNDKVEPVENVRNQTIAILKSLGVNVSETIVKEAGHMLPVEAVDDVASEISVLI